MTRRQSARFVFIVTTISIPWNVGLYLQGQWWQLPAMSVVIGCCEFIKQSHIKYPDIEGDS